MINNLGNMKNLYKELLETTKPLSDKSIFFAQVGENYFEASKKILFLGKSVNSWVSITEKDEQKGIEYILNELFNGSEDKKIVNRKDQMEWVENSAGDEEYYNSNRSQFWQLIRKTAQEYFSDDFNCWYKNIAWSNIYKLSPSMGGTPTKTLCNLQTEVCKKILDEEIKILKPDVIIFLTSSWEEFYLGNLDNYKSLQWKYTTGSGNIDCYTTDYKKDSNGILYIRSKAPQGKKIELHKETILKIIKENNL